MKKIFILKNDQASAVAEKISDAQDDEVMLVIPKGAAVGGSVANLHLLQREAAASKKRLSIETVDETVLALARAAKIEAIHPFLQGSRGPSLSDIVAPDRPEKKNGRKAALSAEPAEEAGPPRKTARRSEAREERRSREAEAEGGAARKRGGLSGFAKALRAALVIVVLAAAGMVSVWAADAFFGRATATISLSHSPWSFSGKVLADTAAAKSYVDAAGNAVVPAELFTADKNLTQLFPATGVQSSGEKAQGQLTVYNGYGAAPQTLVAGTRFEAPGGKIFRIVSRITVPGLKGSVPGSVKVNALADQPGDSYDTGPVGRLSIPGFAGGPKYGKIYGSLLEGASGGSLSGNPVATAADIAAAENKVSGILRTDLQSSLFQNRVSGFAVIDGASLVSLRKLSVNSSTDKNGNFSVFAEASFQALGFREDDLRGLFLSEAQAQNPAYPAVFATSTLTEQGAQPDFTKGRLAFTAAFQGDLAPAFSPDDLRAKITGRSASEAQAAIAAVPGLVSGRLSLWPFWLSAVPADPKRINIVVE